MNIYRLCLRTDWEKALNSGFYEGAELDKQDGFIHASTAELIEDTARKYARGIEDMLLLVLDSDQLASEVKWEKASNGKIYPHIYGSIQVDEVLERIELKMDAAGYQIMPVFSEKKAI